MYFHWLCLSPNALICPYFSLWHVKEDEKTLIVAKRECMSPHGCRFISEVDKIKQSHKDDIWHYQTLVKLIRIGLPFCNISYNKH